jgi:hypothetical protein
MGIEQVSKEIIDYLQGSCATLDEAIDVVLDGEEITEEQKTEIESEISGEIFCCATCGWWHENSDMADDSDNCVECEED